MGKFISEIDDSVLVLMILIGIISLMIPPSSAVVYNNRPPTPTIINNINTVVQNQTFFNASYDLLIPFGYNQSQTAVKQLNDSYNRLWYNYSLVPTAGGGNQSFNQTLTDLLYPSIIWGYNQSTIAVQQLNLSYGPLWVNDTAVILTIISSNNGTWISTFNTTYDAKVSANSTFNQSLTDLLYSPIKWNYNESTIAVQQLNLSYGPLWVNHTSVAVSYLNLTYGPFWVNDTSVAVAYLNLTYGKFWYNMSGNAPGDGSFNSTYAAKTDYAAIPLADSCANTITKCTTDGVAITNLGVTATGVGSRVAVNMTDWTTYSFIARAANASGQTGTTSAWLWDVTNNVPIFNVSLNFNTAVQTTKVSSGTVNKSGVIIIQMFMNNTVSTDDPLVSTANVRFEK